MFNKNLSKVIIILIILFMISFVIIEGLIILNGYAEDIGDVDYMIVLGARLYGELPSPALYERLKVAQEYLNDNTGLKVIASGGQGPDEYISEAEAMKRYFINNGIEEKNYNRR